MGRRLISSLFSRFSNRFHQLRHHNILHYYSLFHIHHRRFNVRLLHYHDLVFKDRRTLTQRRQLKTYTLSRTLSQITARLCALPAIRVTPNRHDTRNANDSCNGTWSTCNRGGIRFAHYVLTTAAQDQAECLTELLSGNTIQEKVYAIFQIQQLVSYCLSH